MAQYMGYRNEGQTTAPTIHCEATEDGECRTTKSAFQFQRSTSDTAATDHITVGATSAPAIVCQAE